MSLKKLKKVTIEEFTTEIAFLIQGRHEKDYPNVRFVFPPTQLNINIHDSYIEFFGIDTLQCRGNPFIEFKGIIPFASILPLNKIIGNGGRSYGELVEKEIKGLGKIKVVYTCDPEGNIIELQSWVKGGSFKNSN